jgi:peptidoglycan/LPS O-acetylase OafA/YrhL
MRGTKDDATAGAHLTNAGSADSHVIGYRADLDGLRAIAVLWVIAYHLSPKFVAGGYLGVDIFFVLSGFLITAIVARETDAATFSIARFYVRRIRRIIPALFVMLFATTAMSVAILLPTDLVFYGRSLLTALGFSANIYFWFDSSDYFARLSDMKPLLHLWSLGVEEQFYILLPPLFALLAGYRRRVLLPAAFALTGASFMMDVFVRYAVDGLSSFYLLPARGWELGAGACLALLPVRAVLRGTGAEVLSLIGAAMILAALALPDHLAALLPRALPAVLGTAAMIFAGANAHPLANRALQFRPLVFCGLISYSLYLWHWPVIVLTQYYLVRDLAPLEKLGALVVIFALASASWRFVERPFRSASISTARVCSIAALSALVLACVAAGLILFRGLPARLSGEAAILDEAVGAHYRCPISGIILFGAEHACAMNLPSRNPADADVVLLGNSYAHMYAPVWASILAGRGKTGLLVTLSGCLPTVESNLNASCRDAASRNLEQVLALRRVKTVIIGLTWPIEPHNRLIGERGNTLDDSGGDALVAALDDLVDRVERSGKHVILIGPLATPGWDMASILSRELAFGRKIERPPFEPLAAFTHLYGGIIAHFSARHDITFVRPDEIECAQTRCEFVIGGRSLFSDSGHVAPAELWRFRPVFEASLR